ncbi:MAG: DUF378 domain-containing protein [Candidatus Pacearchaeota archaeon]|nr:DUF378 domain-containing protein [Candidatus Pacearchaeota archaeon]
MNVIDWIAWALVVIGGLNWGLVGAFSLNVVGAIFGMSVISNIVYILVGLGAIWMIISVLFMKKN